MELKQFLNQANFYIFLWCIYYLQGTLYASGEMISQAILGVLLVISLFNAYYLNQHYKLPIYFKGLNTLIIMFTIYGIYLIISGERIVKDYKIIGNINYIKLIYASLLPIYSAYLYTIKGQLTKYNISIWIFVWLIIATAQYYRYEREALAQFITNIEEITNNSGYIFLALMPSLVIFNKKPLIQFSILLYCLAFILMGMKRGAILLAIVIFIYFVYRTYKYSSYKTRKIIILFTIITTYFSLYLITILIDSSEYFNQRIEKTLDGNVSNRDNIFSKLWNNFLNESNIINLIFGKGANYTIKISGNLAHNDWLEILINNGLVGVLLYIYYWHCFIRSWLKSKNIHIAFSALGMVLCITFVKTFFSMSYGSMDIYMSLTLGYFLAVSNIDKFNYYTKSNHKSTLKL